MNDNERNGECSDCGDKGALVVMHNGPLVPPGTVGRFDHKCWSARVRDEMAGRPVRPLGEQFKGTYDNAS